MNYIVIDIEIRFLLNCPRFLDSSLSLSLSLSLFILLIICSAIFNSTGYSLYCKLDSPFVLTLIYLGFVNP